MFHEDSLRQQQASAREFMRREMTLFSLTQIPVEDFQFKGAPEAANVA